MIDRRFNHGMVKYGLSLYAFGGENRKEDSLDSAETYNILANTWDSLPTLPEEASDIS